MRGLPMLARRQLESQHPQLPLLMHEERRVLVLARSLVDAVDERASRAAHLDALQRRPGRGVRLDRASLVDGKGETESSGRMARWSVVEAQRRGGASVAPSIKPLGPRHQVFGPEAVLEGQ